jgi:hypothetical protein
MTSWVAYQDQDDRAMPYGTIKASEITYSGTLEGACGDLGIPGPYGVGETEEDARVSYVTEHIPEWADAPEYEEIRQILRRRAAQILGAKGGAVKSSAKSEAAKTRNAARKAAGKPEGGRPPKAQA